MTYPPAPPGAPPAPAFTAAPPVAPRRGLPWWGWLLLGLGLLGIVLTTVFWTLSVAGLVATGGVGSPAAPGFGEQPVDAEEPEEAAGVVYTSQDFPFEVTFPGEPTREVIEQAVIGFDLELITVTWAGDGRTVMLGATAFPTDLLPAGGADDTVLQGSLDGAAANVGGSIVEQDFVEVDGQRAITGEILAAGSTFYATVFFRDSVQYSMVSENGSTADHEAFVDSFRFTG